MRKQTRDVEEVVAAFVAREERARYDRATSKRYEDDAQAAWLAKWRERPSLRRRLADRVACWLHRVLP